ncbi:uncharacterized protein Tco025E_02787 [Trypanosoma conorhini]|uniref:Uncharacterized protein n=1 Tax=Trypanosoma conorhini TaxID=83891 RepID=A0A422Q0G1_9TRYP|nr:uncharacterized protein Tco025E_02787 [Trypanosoma conorhini]RNF23495.1 hypothetical protein Tco025E_02787 [Trypanosoma conorhini]
MLTSHYAQVSAMHTVAHEVVNRVALNREEDTQSAYHLAKRDYQLTLNRISSRLPPAPPQVLMQAVDENDLSMYCSSSINAGSLAATQRDRAGLGEELDCREIDEALYARALKRQEEDAKGGGPSWKQEVLRPLDVLLRRESLARDDIEEIETEFYRRITDELRAHSSMWMIDFFDAERRARKEMENAWMSESLPFLETCSMKQVEAIEELWRRAFGRDWRPAVARRPQEEVVAVPLDVRLYQPLQHRCDTIRRETQDEEEIAHRYLKLGEAAQRDLIMRGVMRRNSQTGLLDSVSHPISVRYYEEVSLAFGAEFRYLESCEETQRMAIIDASLAAMDKICTAMMVP